MDSLTLLATRDLSTQLSLPYSSGTVFEPHPQSEERKRSAVTLIKYLLALKKPEVLAVHRRELLTVLLWKITEAESSNKYQENAAPDKVDDILKTAIGCTVTREEHTRLSLFDEDYGWERYRKAGITVIDTQTGEPVI